jgi:hypothetical protein
MGRAEHVALQQSSLTKLAIRVDPGSTLLLAANSADEAEPDESEDNSALVPNGERSDF